MDHYKLFIDGEFVDAQTGEVFESIDPGNEQIIATIARAGKADAEAAIHAARMAFDRPGWSDLTPAARSSKIYDFADELLKLSMRLIITESMDSGQILGIAKFSPSAGAGLFRNLGHYAATSFPWEEEIINSGNPYAPGRDYIRREPIGVCVGIIPWNFPLNMAFWKIAQSIIMGNTIVLKPASSTPLSALIIGEAAQAAGIPPGVINIIAGPGAELGEILCTHPDVDKIAFTGSTEVGRNIMKMGSRTVKKVTLELGGKSANIILDDCDMNLAVEGAVFGTFHHQGQVCESGTRLLVSAKIYDEFIDGLKKRTEMIRVGYQLAPDSHMGPLANSAQLATTEMYVRLGKEEGAQILTGGHRIAIPGIEGGYYYAPTVFTNVKNDMRIAREEIFGPVVCVIKIESDDEAVAIANDSVYGLGGSVFSGNHRRAENIARRVRTGTMWINNYHAFGDFCPFGGYKQSGIGRELGQAGLAEYTQIKRIHVSAFQDREANLLMGELSDNRRYTVQYNCPTNIIAGHGTVSAIYKEVAKLGCSRVMILTDQACVKSGHTKCIQDTLVDFYAGSFEDIPPEADFETVDSAAVHARRLLADCIVSVGGPNVIETGKALCITLKNGGAVNDHIAFMRLTQPQVPHIVVPNTAGSGTEVTPSAELMSRKAGYKMQITDIHIAPSTAILDPRFVTALPAVEKTATAMTAMTHAVEALTSILTNPISDGMALHAIRLIHAYLPQATGQTPDENACLQLQFASTLSGWAYSVSQDGLANAMARTLNDLHHIPHGIACSLVLPAVLRFNAGCATEKYAMIARLIDDNFTASMEKEASRIVADAIDSLMSKLNYPHRHLREFGLNEKSLAACAQQVMSHTGCMLNARTINSPLEIDEIYQQIY